MKLNTIYGDRLNGQMQSVFDTFSSYIECEIVDRWR